VARVDAVGEQPSRAERFVQWSLLNPIGWTAFQLAQLFLAGGVVLIMHVALGEHASRGLLWGAFAVIVLALALVNYAVRRRYLADHEDPDGTSGINR
jgi:hypothetical protein